MAALDPLFRPRSVAIVGASNDPNKVGGRPLAFLRKAGWAGRILPVNPQGGEVQGVRACRSVAEIAEPIDQAIIAVPAAQVLAAAQQCLERGAKALQVFSAGFGEGAGAAQAQRQLKQLAQAFGARVLGPNSLGLFNAVDGYFGTFATALDGAWPAAGGVGVATQSGAFGSYFFGLAQARGLGFSHFVATGNEADVDVADCVGFLAQDPATRLIVIALEGCRDGRKLAAALQAARDAGKPVLAMKVGVSQAGARAAATHTGSLAGEDRVIDAVFREAGAFRAGSLQALVDAAYVASTGPLPRGRRLLVVTSSGGIGVLAADAAEAAQLQLPPIGDAAFDAIRGIAPLADGRNPVDTSAGILGDLSAYARIAAQALQGGGHDAVLCFLAHVPRNPSHWAQLREALYALRRAHAALPFAVVALADEDIVCELEQQHIAHFADPTAAVMALAACAPTLLPPMRTGGRAQVAASVEPSAASAGRGLRFSLHPGEDRDPEPPGGSSLPAASETEALDACLRRHDGGGGTAVRAPREDSGGARGTTAADHASDPPLRLHGPLATESQAKQALAACGIAFAPERVVRDADQAAAAAAALGYPVVLKIVSPDIAHKTEAGGVALDLRDEAVLRAALAAIDRTVRERVPHARIEGYLVARQLRGGVELLVGTQCDPAFGPVVTVGAGGVLAELLQDVCVRLAPVDEAQALAMLQQLRIAPLLRGWRGGPAADLQALARQVALLSAIAWANRDRIASIDLNPVLALPDGACALDALIQPQPQGAPA